MKIFLLCLLAICFFACHKTNKRVNDGEDKNPYRISLAEIAGDSLRVTLSAGGCNGTSWQYELKTDGRVAESSPVQRWVNIDFENNEACLAYITRAVSFSIKHLRVTGESSVALNLSGWKQALIYKY